MRLTGRNASIKQDDELESQSDPVARGTWYADPFGEAGERWWDGRRWTQQVRGEPSPEQARAGAVGRASTAAKSRLMPGWYPWSAGTERYWDGEKWGAKREAVAREGGGRESAKQGGGWLVAAGYVSAVLLPLLGFVLGIVAATRPNESEARKHGVRIIVLSVAVFAIGLLLVIIRHR